VKNNSQQNESRRDVLIRVLRYTALGLLAALGGTVVAKRHKLLRQGKCANRGPCADCEILQDCELPQALSAK